MIDFNCCHFQHVHISFCKSRNCNDLCLLNIERTASENISEADFTQRLQKYQICSTSLFSLQLSKEPSLQLSAVNVNFRKWNIKN